MRVCLGQHVLNGLQRVVLRSQILPSRREHLACVRMEDLLVVVVVVAVAVAVAVAVEVAVVVVIVVVAFAAVVVDDVHNTLSQA